MGGLWCFGCWVEGPFCRGGDLALAASGHPWHWKAGEFLGGWGGERRGHLAGARALGWPNRVPRCWGGAFWISAVPARGAWVPWRIDKKKTHPFRGQLRKPPPRGPATSREGPGGGLSYVCPWFFAPFSRLRIPWAGHSTWGPPVPVMGSAWFQWGQRGRGGESPLGIKQIDGGPGLLRGVGQRSGEKGPKRNNPGTTFGFPWGRGAGGWGGTEGGERAGVFGWGKGGPGGLVPQGLLGTAASWGGGLFGVGGEIGAGGCATWAALDRRWGGGAGGGDISRGSVNHSMFPERDVFHSVRGQFHSLRGPLGGA